MLTEVIISLHLPAFLSGIVCYRLGAFSGCSSPWMANIHATHSSTVDSIHNDIDDPAYFRSSSSLSSVQQQYTSQTTTTSIIDPNDRRFVARPSTPYKCGKISYCIMYRVVCSISHFVFYTTNFIRSCILLSYSFNGRSFH